MLTLVVSPLIYADMDLRNWLAVRDCLVSPTDLGTMEIQFPSAEVMTEFCLRFGHYAVSG